MRAANSTKTWSKKWYPAFHRSCHAHAVLLHEQLDQIGFDVCVQHAAEQINGTALPERSRVAIRIMRRSCRPARATIPPAPVVAKEQRKFSKYKEFPGVPVAAHKRMLQFAALIGVQ